MEGKLTLHEGTRASIPDKTGLVHHDHGMVGDHIRRPGKRPAMNIHYEWMD